MLQSSAPVPLQLPFAANAGAGYTRAIPVASQIAITPGAASFNDGFPPINFLDPVLGGGVPFSGQDVNGVLNAITNALQWEQLNGSAAYNAAVSTAISGYPNGTILKKTGAPGYWMSTVDNNATNPNTGGAGWQGFNPIDGITTIALTNANVTLTAAQYGNPMIVLSGTLSGNVTLFFPAAIGRWIISNTCTGAFTVTAITTAGGSTGYVVPNASTAHVWSNGTNIDLMGKVGQTRAPGTADGTLATTAFVAAAVAVNVPVGSVIEYTGITAPTGFLVCPVAQTNISRTTYAALNAQQAAAGYPFGTGDGSTTFGMPWYPADYASIQASANVGTQSVGAVIAHTHPNVMIAAGAVYTVGATPATLSIGSSGSTGGAANYAAGVRILKCVKY